MEEVQNSDNGPISKSDDTSSSPAITCALCGCSTPAVRCDKCNSQIFCLSCDDMYHRHPKRRLHLRKAVDSIWNSARSPRLRRRTDLPGDPSKIPIPPPRSKKRERHTIGGRMFLKPNHELGSFGHSKVFDIRSLTPPSKDVFAGQKTPTSIDATYENETSFPAPDIENMTKGNEIYENENVPVNQGENMNSSPIGRNPWNVQRTNISSPIQVSIPSSSPELMANGQSFGYPLKPQSRSIADLTGAPPVGPHSYHLPHYHHYMHPPFHPQQYSHSMAHLNCAQCVSSSWSNLMSPHPSPYFHPMPWGSAQGSLARGQAPPGAEGHMKHSHGNLPSYHDPNFPYPFPGGPYYANGAPVMDPNFVRDLHQQANGAKVRKSPKNTQSTEDMVIETRGVEADTGDEDNVEVGTADNIATQEKRAIDEAPPLPPPPPSKPWSCSHCTYVNPPGSHICEVCCKTSFGNQSSSENQNEDRILDSRNSNSSAELVNLSAMSKSPDFLGHKAAQKAEDSIGEDSLENEETTEQFPTEISTITPEPSVMLCTETQTSTTTKSTDVQTQNLAFKSMASSTDSIFPKHEMSVQTETEEAPKNCSVATDPMISSQSMESLLSGMSAPPYHNRRAGWGRGTSFSTQSLYERGRSRSPIPRSASMYNEAHSFGRDSSLPSEEAMHSWSQAWLMSDPMYYKPHNLPGLGQTLVKEDYFDGTWGSMDKLNRRVKSKQGEKLKGYQRPKFHRSLDDLKAEKTQEVIHSQELQFLQTVKEAERCGFSLEDLHVAYLQCGRQNPVFWLEDNWSSMIKNVIALAAKYGEDNEENDVGIITAAEAKEALHIHRGDIWDAVTECIENRQRKILELTVRGNFTQKQISEALKHNDGNVELAYADLLRASSRRHKFILSPGLSEDSEDIALYNPVDDSSADHTAGTSHLRAIKLDTSADSKTERKKSDFLTKLSSIRQAQSERRKAREEKEMIRETSAQELPAPVESRIVSPPVDQEEEEKILESDDIPQPELNAEALQENIEKELIEAELDLSVPPVEDSTVKREGTEDNIPVDYDTNWVESQGEWIEEYSDEQWDEESDGQWIALQKKYQKMEKEFEDEAMQMAALWEKEELEDDVFEEEPKDISPIVQLTEAERMKVEQDEKFQQWVKVNLEKSMSEPEDNEVTEQALTSDLLIDSNLSKSVEFDSNIVCESPLQRYPNAFDLSAKPEAEWIELEVNNENKVLADIEMQKHEEIHDHEIEEQEMLEELDVEPVVSNLTAGISDDEWEKIDENELLELKHEQMISSEANFPEQLKVEETLSKSEVDEGYIHETQFLDENIIEESASVLQDQGSEMSPLPEQSVVNESKPDISKEVSPESTTPRPPLRRKSKLNAAAIEEVLKNQPESSLDVPPAIPLKNKDKSPEKSSITDIYATPEKHRKEEKETSQIASPPMKPPRLNLSPTDETESKGVTEMQSENKRNLNVEFSKEASPATSLSNESDSNCFADSESDPEIKIIRQKYMHRKPAKYENEEDLFEEPGSKVDEIDSSKALRRAVEEASASQGPELPLPVGSRGSRIVDEAASPKAFREGSARPLQLFKVSKQEPPSPVISKEIKSAEVDFYVASKSSEANIPNYSQENIQQQPVVSKYLTSEEERASDAHIASLQSVDSPYYNVSTIEHAQEIKKKEVAKDVLQESVKIQQQDLSNIAPVETERNISEVPLQPSFQEQLTIKEEEEMQVLNEADGMFAAAEYFFGRYNEVTVAKPKKKTTAAKPKSTAISGVPKTMSTSEIKISSGTKSPSPMEMSVSPEIISAATSKDKPVEKPLKVESPPMKTVEIKPSTPEPPKEPVPVEPASSKYISFAEDYFFGSYNQVVVPKKTAKKPLLPAIPKLKGAEKAKSPEAGPSRDKIPNKMTSTVPSPEAGLFGTNQGTLSMTTSFPEVLPPESTNLSSYDENMQEEEQTSFLTETTEDTEQFVEAISFENNESDKISDSKGKSVHFEEPQPVIVPPPRKNRSKPESNASSISSYAEDHRYLDQYNEKLQSSVLDKKKTSSL